MHVRTDSGTSMCQYDAGGWKSKDHVQYVLSEGFPSALAKSVNVPRFIDHDKQTLEHRVALAALNSAALAGIVAFRTVKPNFLQGIKKCYDIILHIYFTGTILFTCFYTAAILGPKQTTKQTKTNKKQKQTNKQTNKNKKRLIMKDDLERPIGFVSN